MKRTTFLATMITVAVAAAPALAASPAGARPEDFHWSGNVAAGAAVEIKGVNGGIVATGAPSGEVEVTAAKKGRKSDPAQVKIEVVEHDGGVTVCAVYPSEGGAPNECKPGPGGRMHVHDNDVNVEFRVKVPAGVRFVGRTVNGGVTATGIAADAEAHSVNGGVEVESGGIARAETVNGGITARLGRADWTGALTLKTVNGGIDVFVPAGLSAEVKASTVNGDIQTDFPLAVTGRISHRSIQGTIGGGGRLLEMETVNGGIALRKAGGAKTD